MLKFLFDDINILGKHISDMTYSWSWSMSSWSCSNCIDFLSAVGFVPATILFAMFFSCWCALSTSSITWDAAATLRLCFSLRYWSWVHFIQWRVCWILICDWNYPYHVWQILLGFTLCTLCILLNRRILHRKITLRLSKRFDISIPPAHHIFLWKPNLMCIPIMSWHHFNVWVWCQVFLLCVPSQYCILISFYCSVGMDIHFLPAIVWLSAGGAHFFWSSSKRVTGTSDITHGCCAWWIIFYYRVTRLLHPWLFGEKFGYCCLGIHLLAFLVLIFLVQAVLILALG